MLHEGRSGDADDTAVNRPGAWPNFLVIGASKCGTTSLWHYLDQHPSVYMSPVKEPMYFCSDDYVAAPGDRHYVMQEHAVRSVGDYLALFSQRSAEPMAGEATTAYIADPATPARIRATLPDVKLVAMIRHPAERVYSEYAYSRAWGIETLPTFEQAIEAELADGPQTHKWRRFVEHGFYGAQLDRYLAVFPISQLRVYRFEDLSDDPHTVMHDLYDFLGVDDTIESDLSTVHNASLPVPRSARLERTLQAVRRSPLTRHVPALLRGRINPAVSRLNHVTPDFPDSVRRRLLDVYAEDTRRVEELLDVDLSAWRS